MNLSSTQNRSVAVRNTVKSHWIFLFMIVYIVLFLLEKLVGLITGPLNVISTVKDLCILAAGLFGFLTAILLGFEKVRGGFFWGNSWPGCLSLGIGLTSYALLRMFQTVLSFQVYMVLVVLTLFFLVGLVMEYRTRKKIMIS